MNIYYTVVPRLQKEDGTPITDMAEMTAQAIVAMVHNQIHVYTFKDKPHFLMAKELFTLYQNRFIVETSRVVAK